MNWILFNWFSAIIFIAFGIWQCRKTFKEHDWNKGYLSYNVFAQGIISGIGSFFLGIVIVYMKITGQW